MIVHKPEAVRVRMLGGFSVGVGSRDIGQNEWRLRQAAALIKLLALAPDHRLHRKQIMDKLWTHLGKRAASNNLRKTLHATRRVLDQAESSQHLVFEEGWLALCPTGALWVDVEAFEEAAVTASREREPAAYRAALNLYAGELLPADRYEEHGEYESAIEALSRVTAEEPGCEEAHAGLMAVIRYFSQLEIVVEGRRVPLRQYWHMDSYEKRNGQWQAVWSQATEIQ